MQVPPEDAEWVRQAQTGDRRAFAALVDRHWEPLRRWLVGLTGQEHLAEDVTQEAFFRAWVGLVELRTGLTFRVWLFRIAHNYLVSTRRGRRGAAMSSLDCEPAGKEPAPLTTLLERECQQNLEAALTRLRPDYRAAYLLWTQEELPYSEIAQILRTTEATARWRVCKARQFLHRELRNYLDSATP